MASRPATYLALFLGTVALVVAVGVGAGVAFDDDAPAAADSTPEAYDLDAMLAEVPDRDGSVEIDSDADSRVIVIDDAHGNSFGERDLGPAIDALAEEGHEIRFYDPISPSGTSMNGTLEDAHAFVSVAPSTRFNEGEVEGLTAFAHGGGRVAVFRGPARRPDGQFGTGTTGSTFPTAPFTSEFGVEFGGGYLYNMAENDNNYRSVYAEPGDDSDLTEGVDRITVTNARPVSVDVGTEVAVGVEGTVQSTSREAGTYPVAVRTQGLLAVGNVEFMSVESVGTADNARFLANVLEFLLDGEEDPIAPGP